jgi:hypothetical protein
MQKKRKPEFFRSRRGLGSTAGSIPEGVSGFDWPRLWESARVGQPVGAAATDGPIKSGLADVKSTVEQVRDEGPPIVTRGQFRVQKRTSLRLRSRLGQPLAIFVIPGVEKTGATFRKPSSTDCVFEGAALAIHCPRALIQDGEKAKLAAA